MATVEFHLDREGIGAMLRSADMREMVMDRARGGAQFAQRIAPTRTGEYQASIHAEDGGIDGDRVAGLVVASAEHAAAVEWGNEHQPHPYHVLGRTVDVMEAG